MADFSLLHLPSPSPIVATPVVDRGLIFAGTTSRDAVAPVIDGWSPAPGTIVDRSGTITVRATDGSALAAMIVSARYPALGLTELVYDGEGFTADYAASLASVAGSTVQLQITRASGFLDALELLVVAIDASGNIGRASAGYEVTGALGTDAPAPANAIFARPSLRALVDRVRGDFRVVEGSEGPFWARSLENAVSKAISGLAHGLHGHLQWVSEQILPDRCGDDGVLRWARILKIPLRPASQSVGTVTFAAADGAELVAGHRMSARDGTVLEVTATVAASGGSLTVPVRSVDAGASTNGSPGDVITLESPALGVTSTGTVDAPGLVGGRDADGIEDTRARVLERLGMPPRGGKVQDYREWALEVDQVASVSVVKRGMGPGTMLIIVSVGGDDPTPPESVLDAVRTHLESKAPGTAKVYVIAPPVTAIDLTVAISPDTPTVRAAVVAAVRELFDAATDRVLLSHLGEAISGAAGEVDHELTSPSANVVLGAGGRARLGTVSWIPMAEPVEEGS